MTALRLVNGGLAARADQVHVALSAGAEPLVQVAEYDGEWKVEWGVDDGRPLLVCHSAHAARQLADTLDADGAPAWGADVASLLCEAAGVVESRHGGLQ